MVEVIANPNIKFKYIVQAPDNLNSESKYQIVFYFHGSLTGTEDENISKVLSEYENGRWIFSPKINESCIFVTPVIGRGIEACLSNGLDVDPQRFSRGCIHDDCKNEFPELYAPHLEIKKIFDDLKIKFGPYKLNNKSIAIGLSAGGSLASRFALLYPEDVCSVLSFINEQLFIPKEKYKEVELPFPFGLSGLDSCPDVELDKDRIQDYLQISKLIYIDRDDDSDSLPWDIDKEFYDQYTALFGKELYKRAVNISEILCGEFKDNIELVITKGNGHRVPNADFDSHIERCIRKVLRSNEES